MKGLFDRKETVILIIAFIVFSMLVLPMSVFFKIRILFPIIYFGILYIILIGLFAKKLVTKSRKKDYKDFISLENIPAEFERIYEDLYHNHIYSVESMRKKIKWRSIIFDIVWILCVIGCFFGNSNYILISREFKLIIIMISSVGLMVSICFIFSNIKNKRKYIQFYKKEIISNFIELINNQLKYKSLVDDVIRTKETYKKAEFDNKPFNKFFADDYIEGFIDNETFIKMCDLHIQLHIDMGKGEYTEEVFQGIFTQIKSNKDIGTYIKISKNKIKILKQQDRVEMDSEEFEKYFDIYAENKIIAMQLLTSDIMETLVNFHNKYGLDYEIVFRNNIIYMRSFTGAMFEPKIFGKSMDKQLLFTYFCILKFIVEISNKVNKTLQETEI